MTINYEVSTVGPKCPYCGYQINADQSYQYSEMGYTEEECGDCDKTFDVSVRHDVTWTTKTRAEE